MTTYQWRRHGIFLVTSLTDENNSHKQTKENRVSIISAPVRKGKIGYSLLRLRTERKTFPQSHTDCCNRKHFSSAFPHVARSSKQIPVNTLNSTEQHFVPAIRNTIADTTQRARFSLISQRLPSGLLFIITIIVSFSARRLVIAGAECVRGSVILARVFETGTARCVPHSREKR